MRLFPERDLDLPLPAYRTAGAAGMDLAAAVEEEVTLAPGEIRLIPTGLALAIPEGFEGQIRPRSGLALKHGISLSNSPGTDRFRLPGRDRAAGDQSGGPAVYDPPGGASGPIGHSTGLSGRPSGNRSPGEHREGPGRLRPQRGLNRPFPPDRWDAPRYFWLGD